MAKRVVRMNKYFDSDGKTFHWEDEPEMLQKRFEVLESKLRVKSLTDELNHLAGSEFIRPMICRTCANQCVKCGKVKKQLSVPTLFCRQCREKLCKECCAICGGSIDMEKEKDEELDAEIRKLKQRKERDAAIRQNRIASCDLRGIRGFPMERETDKKKKRLEELQLEQKQKEARWGVDSMRCMSCDE